MNQAVIGALIVEQQQPVQARGYAMNRTTKRWLLFAAILTGSILLWYLIDHKVISLRNEEEVQLQNKATEATSLEEKIAEEDESANQEDKATKENESDSALHSAPHPTTDRELKAWLSRESKKLDFKDKSPQDTEKKLRFFSGQLRQPQIDQLLSTSLDKEVPANERILSTYLLTLNSTDKSSESLKNLALNKVSEYPNLKPHSADEVARGQELSLKYMAIDQLAERAKRKVDDYNRLVAIANSAPDREIRNYAEQKLKQIGP